LFSLTPLEKRVNLSDVQIKLQSKLIEFSKGKNNDLNNEKVIIDKSEKSQILGKYIDEESKIKPHIQEVKNEDKYIDNLSKKEDFYTKRKKEDSLDSLLEKREEKETFVSHKEDKLEENNEKIEIEKGNEIEIERKEEKKNDIIINMGDDVNEKNNFSFEFYRDEKIVACLNENSKVFGEVFVYPIDKRSLGELSEGDLSYLIIFSKVFSSILFETLNLAGTNLIWDYNAGILRIIPRFEKDGLDNLFLKGEQATSDFLEEIRTKLLVNLNKETVLEKEISDERKEKGEDNREQKEINNNKEGKKEVIDPEDIGDKKVDSDSSLEEKAKYILEHLRRIP